MRISSITCQTFDLHFTVTFPPPPPKEESSYFSLGSSFSNLPILRQQKSSIPGHAPPTFQLMLFFKNSTSVELTRIALSGSMGSTVFTKMMRLKRTAPTRYACRWEILLAVTRISTFQRSTRRISSPSFQLIHDFFSQLRSQPFLACYCTLPDCNSICELSFQEATSGGRVVDLVSKVYRLVVFVHRLELRHFRDHSTSKINYLVRSFYSTLNDNPSDSYESTGETLGTSPNQESNEK